MHKRPDNVNYVYLIEAYLGKYLESCTAELNLQRYSPPPFVNSC